MKTIILLLIAIQISFATFAQTWTNFDVGNSNNPNNDIVKNISFDTKGNVWFATVGGAWKNDGTNWTNFNDNSGLAGTVAYTSAARVMFGLARWEEYQSTMEPIGQIILRAIQILM
jgi:ligand-binding sensor domain-containing protein